MGENKELAVQQVKEEVGGAEIISEEKYEHLVEGIRSIMVERIWNAKEEIMRAKWEIGEAIIEAFEQGGDTEYKHIVYRLSDDLRVSPEELYRCVKFKKKFPDWDQMMSILPEGKSLTWNKIKTYYLPDVPTAKIPFTVPTFDMQDQWGLVKWWIKQPDKNFRLVIKGKDEHTHLEVRLLREKDSDTPLKELFKELGGYFIELKKWDPKHLDHNDYARMNKAIKRLLIKSQGNKDLVKGAIDWCHKHFEGSDIDWSLETVCKKFAQAAKPVKPYEKYLRRPK